MSFLLSGLAGAVGGLFGGGSKKSSDKSTPPTTDPELANMALQANIDNVLNNSAAEQRNLLLNQTIEQGQNSETMYIVLIGGAVLIGLLVLSNRR